MVQISFETPRAVAGAPHTSDHIAIVRVQLSDELPERIALIPRSFGMPVDKPVQVDIRKADKNVLSQIFAGKWIFDNQGKDMEIALFVEWIIKAVLDAGDPDCRFRIHHLYGTKNPGAHASPLRSKPSRDRLDYYSQLQMA